MTVIQDSRLPHRPPNKGMHPTAVSVPPIVNLDGFEVKCAAGDAER
jgi:hypothetical protein